MHDFDQYKKCKKRNNLSSYVTSYHGPTIKYEYYESENKDDFLHCQPIKEENRTNYITTCKKTKTTITI